MSTLGGMISHALSKPRRKSRSSSKWLPRDKWEQKLKKEGKWKDYKKD